MLTGYTEPGPHVPNPDPPELPFLWQSKSSSRTYMRVGNTNTVWPQGPLFLDILVGDHKGYTLQGIVSTAHTSNEEAWKHKLPVGAHVIMQNKADPVCIKTLG